MHEVDRKFSAGDRAKLRARWTTVDSVDLFVRTLPNPNEGIIPEIAGDSHTSDILLERFLKDHFRNNPLTSDASKNARMLLESFDPWKQEMLEGLKDSDLTQKELDELSTEITLENAVHFAKYKADKHRALYKKNKHENTFKEFSFWKKVRIAAKHAHAIELAKNQNTPKP